MTISSVSDELDKISEVYTNKQIKHRRKGNENNGQIPEKNRGLYSYRNDCS